jgi:hypothetical protein
MTISFTPHVRRALLLGLPLGIAACDLVSFIQDPKPIFEQTWNVPADSSQISVAEIVPNGVDIYSTPGSTPPDSIAFQVSVNPVNFARRLGDDCPACQGLNGTTAIKPAFVLATGATTALPTGIVSAALVGGQVIVQITNGFSFDPMRVKTSAPASSDPTQQGRMVIVVRSGSLVVGKDSLNGVNTPFAPGAVLTRTINLQTGNITSTLAVDLTVTSPASDTPVFINANAQLSSTADVPALRAGTIRMNVVNQQLTSIAGDSIPVKDIDKAITKHVVRGGLDMTIYNPFNVTGNLSVQFGFAPGQAIAKSLPLALGTGLRQIVTLDSTEMADLFSASDKVALDVTGNVNSAAPIDVTPKQVLIIVNRLVLTIRTPE